jgi:hypothetical protein
MKTHPPWFQSFSCESFHFFPYPGAAAGNLSRQPHSEWPGTTLVGAPLSPTDTNSERSWELFALRNTMFFFGLFISNVR